jgi:hypothetical protein
MAKKGSFSKSLKNEDTIAKNVQIIHDIKTLNGNGFSCLVWLCFSRVMRLQSLIIEGANFKIGALGILRIQHFPKPFID